MVRQSRRRAEAPKTVSRRGFFSVLGRALQAGKRVILEEAKPDFRPSRVTTMSRRQLLARGLVGAGAIVAARWYGKRKIVEAVFPQSRYAVDFAFLTHEERAHAEQLRSVIETASREGKPFHCISLESPSLRGQEAAFEREINADIQNFQRELKGKNREQIARVEQEVFRRCFKNLQTLHWKNSVFSAQLLVLCFRYGLRFKAGEKYEKAELEKENAISQKMKSANAEIFETTKRLRQNPNSPDRAELLSRLRSALLQFVPVAAEDIRYRNDFIRRTVVGLQGELRKEFPELKGQKPLRVLYVVGGSHEKLFEDAWIKNYREFEAKKHVFPNPYPTLDRLIQQLVRFPNSKISEAEWEQTISEFLSN